MYLHQPRLNFRMFLGLTAVHKALAGVFNPRQIQTSLARCRWAGRLFIIYGVPEGHIQRLSFFSQERIDLESKHGVLVLVIGFEITHGKVNGVV